jgi:hypothetical protein
VSYSQEIIDQIEADQWEIKGTQKSPKNEPYLLIRPDL